MRKIFLFTAVCCLCSMNVLAAVSIIPQPQTITPGTGQMAVSNSSKIVYADSRLQVLADILAEEISRAHGLTLSVLPGTNTSPGDILLKYTADAALTGNVHKITVTDSVTVEGSTYETIAYGSVTVLQAIDNDRIDKMTITDYPDIQYRGLLMDVARQWHSITTIKQIVNLCRLYKVKYLQLHLTDNESFTFPSAAYPALQGPGSRYYSLAELRDLVMYAAHRGVVIIPELEVPGHSKRMCTAMPALFGRLSTSTIDFGNPSVWNAVSNIIEEICDVFTNTPYIHLGADEVWLSSNFYSDPTNLATIATYDLGDMHGVFNYFLNQMNAVVNVNGRNLIIWEGFQSTHSKPNGVMDKNITVMMFDNYKHVKTYYMDNGYDAINASWFPLYVLSNTSGPLSTIYDWQLFTFGNYTDPYPRRYTSVSQYQVPPTTMIPGAQMCSWEQAETTEIPTLRRRLPTAADRLWNDVNSATYTDYTNRLEITDMLFQRYLATGVPSSITPSASMNIYSNKIVVQWLPGDGYPTKYTLLRNTANTTSGATELMTDSAQTRYIDTEAIEGQTYYYWVKAGNHYGYTAAGSSADGRKGTSAPLPYVYEGFDYPAGDTVGGKTGGFGWTTAWTMNDQSVTMNIKNDNLTYPGLQTSGKCVNMTPTGATSPERGEITRTATQSMGYEASELWISFLVRPVVVGDADFALNTGGGAIRKRWGNGVFMPYGTYAPYQLKNGRTYFIAGKYECYNGDDVGFLWLNPTAGTEPPDMNAPDIAKTIPHDIGISDLVRFAMQRFGMEADLDEIRIGSTWEQVCPLNGETGSTGTVSYDGFDYLEGETALGKNGGTGWSGSWFDGGGGLHTNDIGVTSSGLTYTDGNMNVLVTGGNAVEMHPVTMGDPSYMNFDRILGTTYGADGEEVYVSFLVNNVLRNTSLDYRFVIGNYGVDMVVRGWRSVWEVSGTATATTKPAEGETQFVVAKVSFTNGDDSVEFWVNPNLQDPGTPGFTKIVNDFVFDSIRCAQQTPAGFGQQINQFDEIRIGPTYRDVAPMVPEAGSLALAGVAGLLLLRRQAAELPGLHVRRLPDSQPPVDMMDMMDMVDIYGRHGRHGLHGPNTDYS